MYEIWLLVRKNTLTLYFVQYNTNYRFVVMVVNTKQCFECVLVTVRDLFVNYILNA